MMQLMTDLAQTIGGVCAMHSTYAGAVTVIVIIRSFSQTAGTHAGVSVVVTV